ncbi:Peptidylarginine deiminase and related enzymes [Streptococcus pneumoniae]|nr:Peptidylarginine deiminase and related enzymes [Streptococcus pneumoniae]
MDKIDFFIAPTDDVWARDSGPIFVYDNNKNLKILDPA